MRSFAEIAMARLPDSWVVRLARRGGKPKALMLQPKPVGEGDAAAGRRLAAGLLLFDGRLVETAADDPWDVTAPDLAWSDLLHGHGWLDDASAAGDPAIWQKLSGWVWSWLVRYADGAGPGWRPELAARRIVRWIGYAIPLVQGQPQERTDLLFRAVGTHARYLGWRWRQARPGGDRIEALTGLVYATISLEGSGSAAVHAIRMLAEETDRTIAPDGSIISRNPQELARIVTHLIWIDTTIREAGLDADPRLDQALRRAIPVLRTLMGRGGGLARFHGGRSALGARLEETLARGPAVLPSEPNPAMGYLRLKAGPSVVIADAAPVPTGHGAATAHCSACAFEFAHAGQPIVVNQGSGLGFGAELAAEARRRAAHSTIELGGICPGELRPAASDRATAELICPGSVSGRADDDGRTAWALCESTEYERALGLIVERRLDLDTEGPCLSGEDTALAASAESRARFSGRFGDGPDRCPMVLRFHLHPDIRATQTTSAPMVGLILPDNSRWAFRTDAAEVSLAPSRYYERARPMPRAALQIVATSYLIDFWGRIAWSFRQINEGPDG